MIRLPVNRTQPHPDAIAQAADALRRGCVVIYPTDTCYGLGVDARNKSAVRRLIEMKDRNETSKPFSVIVRNIDQIRSLAKTDDAIEVILRQYLPGPFTFILVNLDFRISRSSSIGVRMPSSLTTSLLSAHFGHPYTTTSANIGGLTAPYSYEDIEMSLLIPLKQRGIPEPDLMLDAGKLPKNKPSTIVDLTNDVPKILRRGDGAFGTERAAN